jgi:hypothetical protein
MIEDNGYTKETCNRHYVFFQREYADKMISEADTQIDQDVLKKLISLMNENEDSQNDAIIII